MERQIFYDSNQWLQKQETIYLVRDLSLQRPQLPKLTVVKPILVDLITTLNYSISQEPNI